MTDSLGIIITIIATGVTYIAAMITMLLWLRSEANADRRDIASVLREMKDEMKDFHTRLLILEERFLDIKMKK